MKTVTIVLILMAVTTTVTAAVVNNSTTAPTSEDSLAIIFYSLDSLANPNSADSVFILVAGPSGNVTYRDSVAVTDPRITAPAVAGKQFYLFSEQVSEIDGTGAHGGYTLSLVAKNNADQLLTPNTYHFQIVSSELSDQLARINDSIFVLGGAVDSNRTEQGGGSDSVSIARWVWNTPQANHNQSATFGKYLDTEISGVSGGTGAYSVTLVVYDSSLDQTVPGAQVVVRNIEQTAQLAMGGSDSNGRISFNLDTDSFLVAASAPGYLFSPFDTLVVTGPIIDTVHGFPFDPGTPASPSLCRVWGYLYGLTGQPEFGVAVSLWLPGGVVTLNGTIISPVMVTTSTDSTGYFAVDVIPSDLLNPPDTKYEITITRTDGAILRQRLAVPDYGSWQLTW